MDVLPGLWDFDFFGYSFYSDGLGKSFIDFYFLNLFLKVVKLLCKFNNLLTRYKFPLYWFPNNIPKLSILSHDLKCQLCPILIIPFDQSLYLLVYPLSFNFKLCGFKQLIKCNDCSPVQSVIILPILLPIRTIEQYYFS